MRIGTCIGCQFGRHEHHQLVIQSVPSGMMGGAMCGCKGECQGKPEEHVLREFLLLQPRAEE